MRTPRPWNYNEQIERQADVARWDHEIEQYNARWRPPPEPLVLPPIQWTTFKPWGEVVYDSDRKVYVVLIRKAHHIQTWKLTGDRWYKPWRRPGKKEVSSWRLREHAVEQMHIELKYEWVMYHELKGWMR